MTTKVGFNKDTIRARNIYVTSVETGSTVSATTFSEYITDNATGVTVTLPTTASVGDKLKITGKQGLWVLAQNAGETVYFGNTNTTTGVGGSLTATDAGDCIEIVCLVEDTDWRVSASVGNVTIS